MPAPHSTGCVRGHCFTVPVRRRVRESTGAWQPELAARHGTSTAGGMRCIGQSHLHELRAVRREERHASLGGHRARQERLARARRALQQHAPGHPSAHARVRLRAEQHREDLLDVILHMVDALHSPRPINTAPLHHAIANLACRTTAHRSVLLQSVAATQPPPKHGFNDRGRCVLVFVGS